MSASLGRAASKVGQAAANSAGKAAEAGSSSGKAGGVLKKGAKRDPELYILLAIMTGAFGLAGFYFSQKPTSSSSEAPVSMAEGSMPWQVSSAKGNKADDHFKYQYHPGGDKSKSPKDAPSALHSVIVPNVTLPRKLHDRYNKWGKDDWP